MARFFLLAVALFSLAGCTPIVRDRTLPPSIRAVYVPMIVNRTAEPGLEERMTVAVEEEILADGRLDLVPKKKADATIKITLVDFETAPQRFDGDGFPTNQEYRVLAEMEIIENIPGRPTVGGKRQVRTNHGFSADTRTTGFDSEPRVKERLVRQFGKDIVLEIITGNFLEEDVPKAEGDEKKPLELPRFSSP